MASGASAPSPGEGAEPTSVRWRATLTRALAFAFVGMAADLDLLVDRHSQFTHSLGAVTAVFLLAVALLHRRRRGVMLSLAVAAAYASHPLLDWLGQDDTPPRGIMALWPLTSAYFLSHADLFLGISRHPWRQGAAWHDVVAVSREILLLVPPALGAWWLRGGRHFLRGWGEEAGQQLPHGKGLRPRGESPIEL
jgi:hypothetical protein